MARAKKGTTDVEVKPQSELAELISKFGLAGIVKLAQDCNTNIRVSSTGYPGLDATLQGKHLGLAHGIDVELHSDVGSAGKTTLAIQILAAWQAQGYKTAFIDVETAPGLEDYMNELGLITREEECPPGVYPVWIVRGNVDNATGLGTPLTLQDVFNALETMAKNIFDLIVVDSVDALVQKADMEKTSNDNVQVGGISKKMSEFMRKNTLKKATILWLNQTRESMGYSPSGAPPKKTSGGRAMLFYADIRLKITAINKLEEKRGDSVYIWGFKSKVETLKNKTWSEGMYKSCVLSCVFGEGFSVKYDYFEQALKQGIIVKSGAWYVSEILDIKIQGLPKLYNLISSNEDGVWDRLKSLIDGEDVEDGESEDSGENISQTESLSDLPESPTGS